jgi:hypothetical protein
MISCVRDRHHAGGAKASIAPPRSYLRSGRITYAGAAVLQRAAVMALVVVPGRRGAANPEPMNTDRAE